ncbi:hypothetical protein B0H13DRAFT_1906228 [Mycena leptocephala]|nr:hypothetical protein B0H13DRAFT_1906228 [Mycena leptocephala]
MPQDERSFILALGAAALVALYFLRPEKNVAPVPPGPKGVRILENVPDLPPSQPWKAASTAIVPTSSWVASLWDGTRRPGLIQFGKKWSEYRRLMAQFLGTRSKIETA